MVFACNSNVVRSYIRQIQIICTASDNLTKSPNQLPPIRGFGADTHYTVPPKRSGECSESDIF